MVCHFATPSALTLLTLTKPELPTYQSHRMHKKHILVKSLFSFMLVMGSAFSVYGVERKLDFNRDVRPILSDFCFKCHGPDEQERQAGLRLDTSEGAVAKLESGTIAVVPGDAMQSELIKRITTQDSNTLMPPAGTGKQLNPDQIAILQRWIQEGAEYKGHWAFTPPKKTTIPTPKNMNWTQNPIDAFVAARQEEAGFQPNPVADKVTLIRRVTLDLTGLPPTPAEVDAFLADNEPDALKRVIQRLLKSPRYGEQMGRYWLDLARYGDTHGLHLDNERSMWKYREWVIQAFNDNMPFDQFTVEQIAGDLLPEARLDQRIASGFNRCNVSTSEGGSIDEEVLVRYAVDRTETVGTVWMGLTLGCAVCHDHKFDPISQKEFYRLYAFYSGTADAAMDGNALTPPPIIKVPQAEHEAKLKELDGQLAAARQAIADALSAYKYEEPPGVTIATVTEPADYVWIEDSAPSGAQLQGDTAWEFVAAPDHPVFSGEKATRRKADGLSQHFFTGASPGLKVGEGDKFFAYVYLDPANPPKTIMLQFNDGSWEHRAYWGEDLIPFGAGANPNHFAMGALPELGKWVRLEVKASDVGLNAGAVLNGWAFTQHAGLCYWDKAGIVTKTPQDGKGFESQLAWEAYDKSLTQSTVPQNIRDIAKLEVEKRTPEQVKAIRDYFIENVYTKSREQFAALQKGVADIAKQKTDVENSIPTTMVMAEMPNPRETFVLKRGEYDKKGEKVDAGVPAVLPPLPEGSPANRLGLAKWLTQPSHPLTARVTVNRIWQQFFGRGIVKTSEDFGSQGEWPTHPELLDWLAVDFVENGWDVKRLIEMIMTSNTYQQSSYISPQMAQADPENIYLARGPRFRMDAEVVRDSALAISGLLVEKIGGKSVKPYQPAGLWEAVAFVGSTTQNFSRDSGEALYRRSMYTFWKRTSPPPGLATFDAPSRENCVSRRARTNTPLQALALMNDEQYVEASRHFGERLMKEGGATVPERVQFGFRLATARLPKETELKVLVEYVESQKTLYASRKEDAVKLLSIGESKRDETLDAGELAAYTMLGNLLLNLDETITKE